MSPALGQISAPFFLPVLTTPWHENRKIQYENDLLKAKEPAPDV
jgi:hypothetical protein